MKLEESTILYEETIDFDKVQICNLDKLRQTVVLYNPNHNDVVVLTSQENIPIGDRLKCVKENLRPIIGNSLRLQYSLT